MGLGVHGSTCDVPADVLADVPDVHNINDVDDVNDVNDMIISQC